MSGYTGLKRVPAPTVKPIRARAISVAEPTEAPRVTNPSRWIQNDHTKHELQVPMRDGVSLFTSIHAPSETSSGYPILLVRTPYSVRPYGENEHRQSLGPRRLRVGVVLAQAP